MLAIARYGLAHGVELRINWPGRLAVAPVMGSLFFAMTGLRVLAEVLLYAGLALALTATALYVRTGMRSCARRRRLAVAQTLKLSLTFWAILRAWPAPPASAAGRRRL